MPAFSINPLTVAPGSAQRLQALDIFARCPASISASMAQVFLSLASHNVYYVKPDAMSEMFMSLVSLRLREFETIWLGSRFLARLW